MNRNSRTFRIARTTVGIILLGFIIWSLGNNLARFVDMFRDRGFSELETTVYVPLIVIGALSVVTWVFRTIENYLYRRHKRQRIALMCEATLTELSPSDHLEELLSFEASIQQAMSDSELLPEQRTYLQEMLERVCIAIENHRAHQADNDA